MWRPLSPGVLPTNFSTNLRYNLYFVQPFLYIVCLFVNLKPNDSKLETSSVASDRVSVFERLHYTKGYKDVPSAEIELELSECTFRPKIPTYSPEQAQKLKTKELPKGYEQNVQRVRQSYEFRQKTQEEKEHALFSFDNER